MSQGIGFNFGFASAGIGGSGGASTWEDTLTAGNTSGANDAIWSKTGTATSTATQVGSQIASFQTSLWDGAAEDVQLWDIKSIASTTVDQESRLAFLLDGVEKGAFYSTSFGVGTDGTFPANTRVAFRGATSDATTNILDLQQLDGDSYFTQRSDGRLSLGATTQFGTAQMIISGRNDLSTQETIQITNLSGDVYIDTANNGWLGVSGILEPPVRNSFSGASIFTVTREDGERYFDVSGNCTVNMRSDINGATTMLSVLVTGSGQLFGLRNIGAGGGNFEVANTGNTVIASGVGSAPDANVTLKLLGVNTAATDSGLEVVDSALASKFLVRNDGNVGIGQASPAQLLHVGTDNLLVNTDGRISFGTTTFTDAIWNFDLTTNSIRNGMVVNHDSTSVSSGIALALNNIGTTAPINTGLSITVSGATGGAGANYGLLTSGVNGFGTGTPTAQLHVKDNGATSAIFRVEATGGEDILTILDTPNVAHIVINEEANDIDFRIEGTTDANLFRSDASTQRIGIGIGVPTSKLDVAGNINGTTFSVAGAAGANFSGVITNLTVVDGIVTAAS
jgi:hypothetical protein